MGLAPAVTAWLFGRPFALPAELLRAFDEVLDDLVHEAP